MRYDFVGGPLDGEPIWASIPEDENIEVKIGIDVHLYQFRPILKKGKKQNAFVWKGELINRTNHARVISRHDKAA